MTVLPFSRGSHTRSGPASGGVRVTAVPAHGTFIDSSGRVGSFLGTYRLSRFVEDLGVPAAAGVFAGRLDDADGSLVGVDSRRHTAAVRVAGDGQKMSVRMGPVQVRLFGFAVRTAEIELPVDRPEDREFLLTTEA
jgi:hypothetical protein